MSGGHCGALYRAGGSSRQSATDLWGGPGDGIWQDCGASGLRLVSVTPPQGTPVTIPSGQTWKLYYYAGGQRVTKRELTSSRAR